MLAELLDPEALINGVEADLAESVGEIFLGVYHDTFKGLVLFIEGFDLVFKFEDLPLGGLGLRVEARGLLLIRERDDEDDAGAESDQRSGDTVA